MIQQLHFCVYIQRKWKQDLEEISVLPCLLHYSIAKTWDQLKCLSLDELITEDVNLYIYLYCI